MKIRLCSSASAGRAQAGVAGRISSSGTLTLCALLLLSGCGGSAPRTGTTSGGSTSVVLLATGTANDQLTSLWLTLDGVDLTSQSGSAVSLIATPEDVEFIHLNGTAEPIAVAEVPRGVYTSATASVGAAGFGCVGLEPSTDDLVTGYDAYQQVPSNSVTVSLPAPITIAGDAMALSLDLTVSKSAGYTSCATDARFSITPTFTLAPVTIAAQPSNSGNGREAGLLGLASSVDAAGNSFSAAAPTPGVTWQVQASSSTEFQGVSGLSQLTAGMPLDMDLAIQPGGSLLATRVAVQDTDTNQITLFSGPLLQVGQYSQSGKNNIVSIVLGNQQEGELSVNFNYFNFTETPFQISGQFANVQSLPFPASFAATNMVPARMFPLRLTRSLSRAAPRIRRQPRSPSSRRPSTGRSMRSPARAALQPTP